jgi:predicted ATPase
VARYAEETLGRWLSRAGDARFLVTTREVLGLPGEEILALAPLASSDAADLFVRRAEAAKPGFQPSAEDQLAIGPLVKLLEGLPLAIELAAARVRVMPPRMLLLRMTERFKLLLSSTGGRLDRQATLRAVFDWSWDLLSLPEKARLPNWLCSRADSRSSRWRRFLTSLRMKCAVAMDAAIRWYKSHWSGQTTDLASISS